MTTALTIQNGSHTSAQQEQNGERNTIQTKLSQILSIETVLVLLTIMHAVS